MPKLDETRWPLYVKLAALSVQSNDVDVLLKANAVMSGVTYYARALLNESLTDEERADRVEEFIREDSVAQSLFAEN